MQRVGTLFRRLLLLAVVTLLAWGVVVAAASRTVGNKDDIDAIVGDVCSYDRRSDPGRTHVAQPRYTVDPPSGGPHAVTFASAGFKEPDALPTDGELVHAMEHGAVVVWYRSLDAGEARHVRRLADEDAAVIVVSRPALPTPLAVTAWHRRMLCDRLDMEATRMFVRAFRGRGPERVGI